MDNIGLITNADFGLKHIELNNPEIRIAARAIVINNEGKIAIFNKSNKNEYKLPGGGVEDNEKIEEALVRECLEETGCNIKIIKKLCTIEEHRENYNFKQISHVYVTKVIGEPHELQLTEKEIAEGGKLIWVLPNEGYELIKNSINNIKSSIYEDVYSTRFIVTRDKMILEYYLNNK